MVDFNRNNAVTGTAAAYDEGLRAYMLKVYNYMALALSITGLVAYVAASTPAIVAMLYRVNQAGQPVGFSLAGYIILLSPLIMVMFLGARMNSLSFRGAQTAFWIYSALMGLSLSSIFLIYTNASIARVFFVTAGTFAAMSLYGYTTKRDLTGFGSFLIMGVWGIVIASLVNLFLHSSGMYYIVSILGALIFTGLTAYDTQRIKQNYYQFQGTGEMEGKVAIMGALSLYISFINIFMSLMQLFGNRR